jgi:hypothetical protein
MIKYALVKHPDLASLEEIRAKYDQLPTPVSAGMVLDMRESDLLRSWGEYYPEDYAEKKKAKLLGQFEFDFEDVFGGLQRLCNPKAELPEDAEKLEELVGTLKSAAIRVERKIKELKNTVEAQ